MLASCRPSITCLVGECKLAFQRITQSPEAVSSQRLQSSNWHRLCAERLNAMQRCHPTLFTVVPAVLRKHHCARKKPWWPPTALREPCRQQSLNTGRPLTMAVQSLRLLVLLPAWCCRTGVVPNQCCSRQCLRAGTKNKSGFAPWPCAAYECLAQASQGVLAGMHIKLLSARGHLRTLQMSRWAIWPRQCLVRLP